MDVLQGQIGAEGKYAMKLEGGKLIVEVSHDTQLLDSKLELKLDASMVVDLLINKLEEVIPGDQKAMAELLKAGLKGAM